MTQDALARLIALAKKATPGPWTLRACSNGGVLVERQRQTLQVVPVADGEYIAACSPEVIAALVRVAMAADSILNGHHGEDESTLHDPLRELDAALAKGKI